MPSVPSRSALSTDLASLVQALNALPKEHRRALELKVLEGRSLASVAEHLLCTEQEVVLLLRQALLGIHSVGATDSQAPTFSFHSHHTVIEQQLDALLEKYFQAGDSNSPLDRNELIQANADLAQELLQVFAGMDRLTACAASLRQVLPSLLTLTLARSSTTLPETAARDRSRPPTPSIPDFDIQGVLGEGGMGIVYLARQISLPRWVALKMIRASLTGGRNALARFREETNAIARLNHPHIIQIYSIGEHQGEPYCVLEYAEGGTLANRLGRQPQAARTSAEWVRTLALTMQKVHQASIVHLDLKPGNILLTSEGTLKITDFGLARYLAEDAGQIRPGEIAGTPSYMAPEQAHGRTAEIGPVSDVYALGAILYEMLTGRPPFKEATPQKTLEKVRTAAVIPVRQLQPGVPRDLEAIVHRCLEKDPAQRYPSAEVLAERLQRFLDGKPIPERPRPWYHRVADAVSQRPMLSSFVGVCLLAVLVAGLVVANLPRESTREDLLGTLAAGREYVFRGDETLPGPFRQVYGDPAPLTPNPKGNHFSIDSHRVVLWELINPGIDRYEFTAEVRHDASGGNSLSQVGIYLGFRTIPLEGDYRQGGYYAFLFADSGSAVKLSPGRPPQGEARLSARQFREAEVHHDENNGRGIGIPFDAAVPLVGPGPWRRLRLKVSPEEVEVSWQPDLAQVVPVGTLAAADLEHLFISMARPLPRFRAIPTEYNPNLGLGLYVSRGKASFRNVTLTPLATP